MAIVENGTKAEEVYKAIWKKCRRDYQFTEIQNSDDIDKPEVYALKIGNMLFIGKIKLVSEDEFEITVKFGNGKTGIGFIDMWKELHGDMSWEKARKFVEIWIKRFFQDA